MSNDIKEKVIEILEKNQINSGSQEIAKRYLQSIKNSDLQSFTENELDSSRIGDIYEKRLRTLRMRRKKVEGFYELLSELRAANYSVKVAQFVGSVWNITVFVDSEVEHVVGLIAIES